MVAWEFGIGYKKAFTEFVDLTVLWVVISFLRWHFDVAESHVGVLLVDLLASGGVDHLLEYALPLSVGVVK